MQLSPGADAALLDLLSLLGAAGYSFVAPTPATHARVVARPDKREAQDLRDVFGWSLSFARPLLPAPILDALERAGALSEKDGRFTSELRVASLGGRLFLHSAYPTEGKNDVFFGPDTYRFVSFLRSELPGSEARRLVDLGAGAGAGAILAVSLLPEARLTLVDTNPLALRLAGINARHAGVEVEHIEGAGMDEVAGEIDLVIANPPFIMDEGDRQYRNGGDMHGARLSYDWAMAAARRLLRPGRMLLYTGAAIVDGRDLLREALERDLPPLGCTLRYREIDPDIFGEELEKPAYRDVERIAAIGAVVEAAG